MRATLKKAFLLSVQASTPLLNAIFSARRKFFFDDHVVIIGYHKISELTHGPGSEWNVSPAMLAKHMDVLAQNDFNVISLEAFFQCIRSQTSPPRNSVVITLDDGYASVFEHAYPLLLKHRFPATIFQTVKFADEQRLFPWDDEAYGDDPHAFERFRPLSWDEIGIMCNSGIITMGSHTMTHPHLGLLSREQIIYEVAESKRLLELHTGQTVTFFAFPGGIRRYGDISDTSIEILMNHGFELACTSSIGRNTISQDPYGLKRIGIGHRDSVSVFRAKLIGAYDWLNVAQGVFQRFFNTRW